jgi:protein O-mannosyl-transferase
MKNLLILLLLWPFLIYGQTEKSGSSIQPMASTPKVGATFAVVVGISDYQNIPDLKYADKDAEAFADFLRSAPGGSLDKNHLQLLTNQNATAGKVGAALGALIDQVKEGDHVIIYFSGHGDVESKMYSQPGFLLCWDSPLTVYMGGGTFSLTYLQENITTLSLGNHAKVTVITDVCHAGKLSGSQIGGAQLTAANAAIQYTNELKILSCSPKEFSLEGSQWGGGRGCFSYHLVNGLYGLADTNGDAIVTVSEIDRYLEDHVTREAAPYSQTPMILGGEKKDPLSTIDSAILRQLERYKRGELPKFSPAESRVFEEKLLAGLSPVGFEMKADSSVWGFYHQFKLAMEEKRLLEPADNCAERYYQQLIKINAMKPLYGFMTRNYAAALQDEAQQAVNAILKTNVGEVTASAAKKMKKYEHFPELLARSAELLGPQHYMYTTLKARQLAFEGLLLYFETYFSKDPENAKPVLEKYRQSLKYQWESPFTHYYMSLCFVLKANQPDSALVHARLASSMAQTWVLPYAHLAYYLSRDPYMRYEEAKSLLDDAMRMDSSSTVVWMGLGAFYHYQLRFPEAAKAYRKVLEMDSTIVLARVNLGVGLIEMKEYEEAESKLLQVLAIKPDHFFANYVLACMYDRLDRQTEAEKLYLKALSINPSHILSRDSLAKMFWAQGRLKEAESINLEIIKLDSTQSEAWYRLGCIAAREGRTAEVIDSLEKSMENDLKNTSRLKTDPALDPIRASESFRIFLKKAFPLDHRE